MDVAELKTWQLGLVSISFCVEPSAQQIDDLDRAFFARSGLEEFFVAGTHRAFLHRAFDNGETGSDLVRIGRRAVTAQQELADVRRDRVLTAELLREVLSNEVALEHLASNA